MHIEKQKDYEEVPIHDDGIAPIIAGLTEKQSKVVVFDADSVVFFTIYNGKDEYGNKNPEFTEDDLDYLKSKLSEMVMKYINAVEKYWDIEALYIFCKGKNNFRKKLFPEYKANRNPPNPLVNPLFEYLIETFQAIESHGGESDDMCYEIASKLNFDCIVMCCDKDLSQMPCTFYDFKRDFWYKISKKEAKFNLYRQYVIGDATDNVNFSKGIGLAYFNKNFHIDMTDNEYEEALLKAYVKVWKDEIIAKEKIELVKKLLTLRSSEDFDKI